MSPSSIRLLDGDVHNARQLRETPLTDEDVGHYNKKLSATCSPGVFDWSCDAEGLNILAWSHEFSKLYFSCGQTVTCLRTNWKNVLGTCSMQKCRVTHEMMSVETGVGERICLRRNVAYPISKGTRDAVQSRIYHNSARRLTILNSAIG